MRQGYVSLSLLGIAALAMAACTTPPSLPAGTPSPSASGAARVLCAGGELVGPDGARVNLTGTWQEPLSSGPFLVTHSGSCITMEGFSARPNEPLGARYRAVFSGVLQPDFTIVGTWMWTWYWPSPVPDDPRTGQARVYTAGVTFDASGGPVIELGDLYDFQFGTTLERLDTSTALPDAP